MVIVLMTGTDQVLFLPWFEMQRQRIGGILVVRVALPVMWKSGLATGGPAVTVEGKACKCEEQGSNWRGKTTISRRTAKPKQEVGIVKCLANLSRAPLLPQSHWHCLSTLPMTCSDPASNQGYSNTLTRFLQGASINSICCCCQPVQQLLLPQSPQQDLEVTRRAETTDKNTHRLWTSCSQILPLRW